MPHLESIILYLTRSVNRFFDEVQMKMNHIVNSVRVLKKKCPICNSIRNNDGFLPHEKERHKQIDKFYQYNLSSFLKSWMVSNRVRFITVEITLMNWNKECRDSKQSASINHNTATSVRNINQIKIHQITRQIESVVRCAIGKKIHSKLFVSLLQTLITVDLRWRLSCAMPKMDHLTMTLCFKLMDGIGSTQRITIILNELLYASLFLIIYTIGNGYALILGCIALNFNNDFFKNWGIFSIQFLVALYLILGFKLFVLELYQTNVKITCLNIILFSHSIQMSIVWNNHLK